MIKLFKLFRLAGIFNLLLFTTFIASAQPINTTALVAGNSQFAFDLYARLKTNDGNLFFSPYGISTCLAMTESGARGNTAAQMARVLHFNTNQDGVHSQFNGLQDKLFEELAGVRDNKQVALNLANAIWTQRDHPFLAAFLEIAARRYSAMVQQADFRTAAEATRQEINDWVGSKTAGRIPDLIPPGALNSMTRLVLVNAIYFKGKWAKPFKTNDTAPAPFTTAPGQTTTAQFMNLTARFNYGEADGLQYLELPYAGGDLSMVVLLPREPGGLKALEDGLSEKTLLPVIQQKGAMQPKVNVFLPKFKLTGQFALADTLAGMGMTDAFSDRADFSGMDGAHDLRISAVIHKAFVEVNEEGTEAAAATGVVVSTMAVMQPVSIPVFRADHPFLFLIRDVHSGSILFLGRVIDPGR